MKIMVLLKQTPDTETKINISSDQKSLETGDVKYIINPYDEFAIEEAIQIKEKAGSGEVIVASFGNDSVKELIVKALAMGADRGLLISNAGHENTDSLGVAKVLAGAVKAESPDLVIGGKQAIDDDNMHVHVMLSELMNWPHVNVVNKLELNGSNATVEREIEGGQTEVYEISLPAVIGANKALNTPRYTSLPGIMKAKKKPFDNKKPEDFGVDAAALAAKANIVSYSYPAEKPPGKMFKDDSVENMVGEVVKLLREEAKVI